MQRLKLLVILPTSPLPIFSGGRQRVYQTLKQLSRRHDITVLSFWREQEAEHGLAMLAQDLPLTVRAIPFQRPRLNRNLPGTLHRQWRSRRSVLPRDVIIWDQSAMHYAIEDVLNRQNIDILQIEWPFLSPYALNRPATRNILITHDIFSLALQRRATLSEDARLRKRLKRQAQTWRSYEQTLYARLNAVAAMSAVDAQVILRRSAVANVHILPNGVDVQQFQPSLMRKQVRKLLFVGSPTHAPNIDGAIWFLQNVWPVLKQHHPEIKMTLVNFLHPDVLSAMQPDVEITGRLPDLAPLYQQADIVIVPIRTGSGTRLKILEAFAAGVPVISTTIGCEGLEVVAGKQLWIADTADEFVQAISSLCANVSLRQELSTQARHLVEDRYDWSRIADLYDDAYQAVLSRT